MAVVSIATLKTYFQALDFPTESQFVDLIDTLENSSTSIYKRYVSKLNQSATAAPVATILENTVGAIVWSRTGAGNYLATLTGAFSAQNKVSILFSGGEEGGVSDNYAYGWNDANSIYFNTFTDGQTRITTGDDMLFGQTIEIRVYP